MAIYIVIFLIILFFCSFEVKNINNRIIIFGTIWFILILLAGLRSAQASTDYEVYLDFFKSIKPGIIFFLRESPAEPFYNFIPAFVKLLGLPVTISFLIFAIIGVSFKAIAIINSTKLIFFSLLIYYSNFFMLHEMTQIRIGVAIGIYLLGLKYIMNKELLKFSIIIILATCFHFSAIILGLTYFFNLNTFNKKKYLALMILVIPLSILQLDPLFFLKSLPLGVFSEKLEFYYGAMQTGVFEKKINIFNIFTIIDIAICFLFIFKIEFLQTKFKYANLFLKMYVCSLLIFFVLSFIPPLAFRFRELFQSVQILLIPQIIFLFKERYVGKLIVISIGFIMFYINVIHLQLVKNYF